LYSDAAALYDLGHDVTDEPVVRMPGPTLRTKTDHRIRLQGTQDAVHVVSQSFEIVKRRHATILVAEQNRRPDAKLPGSAAAFLGSDLSQRVTGRDARMVANTFTPIRGDDEVDIVTLTSVPRQ
jgi:hypothetical protein